MSININVNGMKCYADRAAAEKRKIKRLLTVREQSNELAHKLRNKVRAAQEQELKKLQKQSQKELGEWKRRNHCQIQAKIDECLADFGNAHIAAVDASCEENEFMRQEREEKDLMAAVRGRKAMLQVQRERDKQAEERLLKKKKYNQKTTGTQADFLTQHGFSEIMAQKKRVQHTSDDDEEEVDESESAVFTSKPNLHKHSIKIDTNYNAQNYTSNSVESSNNCDSDEVEELEEDEEEQSESSTDDIEFDQIKKILQQQSQVKTPKDDHDDADSISESTSSVELISPQKKSAKKKLLPTPKKKKGILKKSSPNKKITKTKSNPSPVKKTSKPAPVVENRVRYVDYTKGNYETTYVPKSDLVTRSEKTKLNAKQEAQVQTDDHAISKKINADILKQLTEIRSQEALEKEKIRRDYERLRSELDELSKLEQEARVKTNTHRNISRDQLLRKEETRQKKMNEAAENVMRGNIVIHPPPVDRNEKSSSSVKQKSNVNNVATLNSIASVPQQQPTTDANKKKTNEELNNIVKVERLKDLLEKINHQKRLLLNEIEKSEDVPGPDLEKVMECLVKLESEKAQLDADNKISEAVKNQNEQKLTERERKVREREQRLENKLRQLFKQQKEATVQSSSSSTTVSPPESVSQVSSSTSQGKKVAQTPVEIIIKVQQPKSPHRKSKKSYRCVDTLSREPGKVYPKTPIRKKKDTSVEIEEINEMPEKPEVDKEQKQQQTQTSPASSEILKPILKSSQIPSTQDKSNIPLQQKPATIVDPEDFSLSTVYRELPPKIHLNQQAKQKKPPHALNPNLVYYITRLLGMSKNIGNQLNVDVSSISTPGSSTINTSGNVSSVNEVNFDNDRMDRLQKFIDDNYSFLSEINDSLERAHLQQKQEDNFEKVQGIWGEVLRKSKPKTSLENQSKASSSQMKSAPTQSKTIPSTSASVKPNKNKSQLPQNAPKIKRPTNLTQQPSVIKSRPQTVPIQTRPQISTDEMEKVTKYLESKMMNNYKEYTDKCQNRINELTKMMEQVRQEKLKLIENSLSSNECNNFTEYKDIVQNNAGGSSDQKDSPSNRDDPPSEEINNILKTQSRPFGMSKDSGIASSRPVTSSDFRDSPDARVTSEENAAATNVFQPIASRVKVPTTEGSSQAIKNISQIIRQTQEEKKKQHLQLKPPLSIKSFSPHVEKLHEGHELSAIAEIETPSTSKKNIVADESVGVGDLHSFPNFEEYASKMKNFQVERSFPGMDSLKNALPDMHVKTFVGPQEYDIVELSKDYECSSSGSSLMDIQEELKSRRIFEKSFEFVIDEEGDVNLVKSAAPNRGNDDDKTTPTTTRHTTEPMSPKRKPPAQSRIVIKTPDNVANIEIITTPTKTRKQRKVPEPHSPKSSDTLTGIQEIDDDLTGVGMKWAANMLKRTEETQQKGGSSSSSEEKKAEIKIDLGSSSSSSDGRPLNLKEFLTRELVSKTNYLSDDSSLSSRFLKSLLNASTGSTSSKSSNPKSDSTSNAKLRTSTPVRMSTDHITTTKTAASSQLFTGADSVSTVKDSSGNSTEKSEKDNELKF